jgi:hypothetical protein
MNRLTYTGQLVGYQKNDIIDAEFTVVHDPTWLERLSQIAFYNHINSIVAPQIKKVVDILV